MAKTSNETNEKMIRKAIKSLKKLLKKFKNKNKSNSSEIGTYDIANESVLDIPDFATEHAVVCCQKTSTSTSSTSTPVKKQCPGCYRNGDGVYNPHPSQTHHYMVDNGCLNPPDYDNEPFK
jgi:hypothetical protein